MNKRSKVNKTDSNATTWARKRNWDKFLLCGMLSQLHLLLSSDTLLGPERFHIGEAIGELSDILSRWEEMGKYSKSIYVAR